MIRKGAQRFVGEAELKHNYRNLSDADRTVELIQSSAQRRLTYAEQVTNHD